MRNLDKGLWDEYALAQQSIVGWHDMGTYNSASRLPSGAPSDHAVYPARAFDAGFANTPAGKQSAEDFAAKMIGRPGVHYVILGDLIWSTERGLHTYTAGGHGNHVHVSELAPGMIA